jgi:hypothetical protein
MKGEERSTVRHRDQILIQIISPEDPQFSKLALDIATSKSKHAD